MKRLIPRRILRCTRGLRSLLMVAGDSGSRSYHKSLGYAGEHRVGLLVHGLPLVGVGIVAALVSIALQVE
jgi:hypothetical protein